MNENIKCIITFTLFCRNQSPTGLTLFICFIYSTGEMNMAGSIHGIVDIPAYDYMYLSLPFRPLYNNMSLLSILHFLRDSHFKSLKKWRIDSRLILLYKNACHAPSFKVIASCYKPSRSLLNFFKLILKAYTRGVPNRTTIFQDWAHQSFICCLFHLLWTSVKILSQEAKGPISLSAKCKHC